MKLSSSLRSLGLISCAFAVMSSVRLAQAGKGKPGTAAPQSAHVMTTPDSLKWEPLPAAMFHGTPPVDTTSSWRYARLKGDPLKRGPYAVEVRCTDGSQAAPHWHPLEENIVVVKGTFALATGDTYDAAALHDLITGSYVFMPKRVHHFALCKGETVLVEYGIGPFTINLLGAPKGAVKQAATK